MADEATTLSDPARRVRRWSLVTILAPLIALLVLALMYLAKHNAEVREAVDRLEPGMTQAEVKALLAPANAVPVTDRQGCVTYTFYGVDEFIIVKLEKDGDETRVKTIEHLRDEGPTYERLRRRLEHRFR